MNKKFMRIQILRHTSPAHWILFLILLANAVVLFPEISIGRFPLNDSVLHLAMAQRMVRAMERGENPLDCWTSEWTLGYPVSRTYQPLGHLTLAFLYEVFRGTISLPTIFTWCFYLLICLLPMTVYITARRLELPPSIAVACSAVAPLISTNGLYGLDYGSYVWRGSGLFTQALAIHFLLLALAQSRRVMLGKGSAVLGGVVVGVTFLAHFVYGYIAAVSTVIGALVPGPARRTVRAIRLAYIGITAFALTAFQLVAVLTDAPFLNQSRWEPALKWDSFGASEVLKMLFKGHLLDYGRFPVLTFLALAGVIVCVVPRLRHQLPKHFHTFVLSGSAIWLAMFSGRPTWGTVMNWIAGGLPLHRLIGAVHVFAIFLAGIGLATLWDQFAQNFRHWGRAVPLLVTAFLLLPAALERGEFLSTNREWGEATVRSFEVEKDDIEKTLAAAKAQPGRVYAGLATSWGSEFRVGSVPVYAILGLNAVPAVAFLYHAMALTSDIMVLFDESNPVHYRLFNVTSVVSDTARQLPAWVGPSETFGRFRISQAPGGGYFDVVSVPYAVTTDKRSYYEINNRWLQSTWAASQHHLLLDFGTGSPEGMARLQATDDLPQPRADEPGSVQSEQRDHETYRAVVTLRHPAYVLFKMTYHPKWLALVDGKIRSTVMLSPGFTGVPIESGRHEIELRYEPGRMRTVLLIAGIVVVLALARLERSGGRNA